MVLGAREVVQSRLMSLAVTEPLQCGLHSVSGKAPFVAKKLHRRLWIKCPPHDLVRPGHRRPEKEIANSIHVFRERRTDFGGKRSKRAVIANESEGGLGPDPWHTPVEVGSNEDRDIDELVSAETEPPQPRFELDQFRSNGA